MILQNHLNQKLLEEQASRSGRKSSGKFHPSKLGRCYRLQYWSRAGEAKTSTKDDRTLRVLKMGSVIHEWIQGYYPREQCEVRIENDDFLGFADIVLDNSVIDIKTCHSRQLWHMGKDDYRIEVKKKHDILQVMFYVKMLGKSRGILCYVSKDDACVAEKIFYLNTWEAVLDKEISTLLGYWNTKTLPPADPRAYPDNKGKFNDCKYCDWQDKCKEVESEHTRDTGDKPSVKG